MSTQAAHPLDNWAQQLFSPFIGEGLDKTVKNLVERTVKSFFPLAPGTCTEKEAIFAAVTPKLDEMVEALFAAGTELGQAWAAAFDEASTKLLTHKQKALLKTLFKVFMRGVEKETALGVTNVDALMSFVALYTDFGQREVGLLQKEYQERRKSLHAQLQRDRILSYYLNGLFKTCGEDGVERLGRLLTRARSPPTPATYQIEPQGPEQLRALLNQYQHHRQTLSWGDNERLTGGTIITGQLPVLLGVQIGLGGTCAEDKEALADAVVGRLMMHQNDLAEVGQQAVVDPDSIAALRRDPILLLQTFASLHETPVDILYALSDKVIGVFRVSPSSAPAQTGVSYKLCWSKMKGFGPASLSRQHLPGQSSGVMLPP